MRTGVSDDLILILKFLDCFDIFVILLKLIYREIVGLLKLWRLVLTTRQLLKLTVVVVLSNTGWEVTLFSGGSDFIFKDLLITTGYYVFY